RQLDEDGAVPPRGPADEGVQLLQAGVELRAELGRELQRLGDVVHRVGHDVCAGAGKRAHDRVEVLLEPVCVQLLVEEVVPTAYEGREVVTEVDGRLDLLAANLVRERIGLSEVQVLDSTRFAADRI